MQMDTQTVILTSIFHQLKCINQQLTKLSERVKVLEDQKKTIMKVDSPNPNPINSVNLHTYKHTLHTNL